MISLVETNKQYSAMFINNPKINQITYIKVA